MKHNLFIIWPENYFEGLIFFAKRLTMNDRVNLTEAEMSEFDSESGNRRGNSGNDDEQDGVKYSW